MKLCKRRKMCRTVCW